MLEKNKKVIDTKAVFNVFWEHTKRYPWLFGITIVGAFLTQLSNIIGPLFMRDLFNLLATLPPASAALRPLMLILVGYAIISLIGWFGGRIEMWFGYTLIAKVTANLTKEAFQNLMRHSHHFFASSFSGALTRRVGRFSGAYENLYYAIVITVFEAVIYVIGIVIVLLFHNILLGIIIIGWVLFFVTLQWWLNKWQHPYRIMRAQADTDVTAALADSISNQNTVALFSANTYEEALVGKAAARLEKVQLKSWSLNSIIYGFQGLLTNILNVGMLAVGVVLWSKGIISLGDVVLIQAYVFGIFSSVWNLGRQFYIIYNSLADASEMLEITNTPIEVQDNSKAKNIKITDGKIWFDAVSFYFNKESQLLDDFNVHIHGGEKVALVGPSGAGKSTITKLLLRLYDIKGGHINIDGQDISAVTQDSLRDAIGFVPQEPVLFHRTLMDNIRYGKRDATDAEVIEAAKKANCHDFISQLPEKYETFVGERGIKLSGGERQRVAIARAILKDAPILVLDEATSSLDSESEMLIQQALDILMQNKTVIVIAHRLSTVMKMDRIIVIDGGKVVAAGTHSELLNQEGLYAKLWSIQAGGFIPDEDKPTSEPLAEE